MPAIPESAKQAIPLMFEEIINKKNLDAIPDFFAEDFVDHGPMGDSRGLQAFRQLVQQWLDAVPDVHCAVENVIEEGDIAAWLVRTTGTHTGDGLGFPATGKRFETLSANIGRRNAERKAVEHWSEQGIFPMLAQLGIIPAMGVTAGAGS